MYTLMSMKINTLQSTLRYLESQGFAPHTLQSSGRAGLSSRKHLTEFHPVGKLSRHHRVPPANVAPCHCCPARHTCW